MLSLAKFRYLILNQIYTLILLYHTASDNMQCQHTSTQARTPLTFHDMNFMFHFFPLFVVASDVAAVLSAWGTSASLVCFLLLVWHPEQHQIKLTTTFMISLNQKYLQQYWNHKELSVPLHSLLLVPHPQLKLPVNTYTTVTDLHKKFRIQCWITPWIQRRRWMG